MTAMFCFFLLAMPQVILDPSSPTRDGTLALCSLGGPTTAIY